MELGVFPDLLVGIPFFEGGGRLEGEGFEGGAGEGEVWEEVSEEFVGGGSRVWVTLMGEGNCQGLFWAETKVVAGVGGGAERGILGGG